MIVTFTLDAVVPWGRSFDEYRAMFALTGADLRRRILGCADGPASFNAELTAAGGSVTSCDPLYRDSAAEISRRIDDASPVMIDQARKNTDMFVWGGMFADPDSLGRHRLATMGRFLADYEKGQLQARYCVAELPTLPFSDHSFDIALCSHFLFLYSDQLSAEFHIAAVCELIRVAREVRIFPVTELAAVPSRHLQPVTSALTRAGNQVVVETVDYEFQRGGNQMMRILHPECHRDCSDMSATAIQVARRFAAILDRRQYDRLREVLSLDCQYEFRDCLIKGRTEIIEVYRQNTEWGFDVFDRIEFHSDVLPDSEDSARVTFTDRLFHKREVHDHKCQQIVSMDDGGLIRQIVHIDLEGEGPALDAFFEKCGVVRPQHD